MGRGPVTYPPEWIRAFAEVLRRAFAGEGEVTINDPFVGGYISQFHYERKGTPWIQMEINRKLYLNETYFDPERLRVKKEIILRLRKKIFGSVMEIMHELK